jgi:hypothetical protein
LKSRVKSIYVLEGTENKVRLQREKILKNEWN